MDHEKKLGDFEFAYDFFMEWEKKNNPSKYAYDVGMIASMLLEYRNHGDRLTKEEIIKIEERAYKKGLVDGANGATEEFLKRNKK